MRVYTHNFKVRWFSATGRAIALFITHHYYRTLSLSLSFQATSTGIDFTFSINQNLQTCNILQSILRQNDHLEGFPFSSSKMLRATFNYILGTVTIEIKQELWYYHLDERVALL